MLHGKKMCNIVIWIQGTEMIWREQNSVFLLPCKFFPIPYTSLVQVTFRLVSVTFCTHKKCNFNTHIKIQGQTNTYNEIPFNYSLDGLLFLQEIEAVTTRGLCKITFRNCSIQNRYNNYKIIYLLTESFYIKKTVTSSILSHSFLKQWHKQKHGFDVCSLCDIHKPLSCGCAVTNTGTSKMKITTVVSTKIIVNQV